MSHKHTILHLSLIPSIGPGTIERLVQSLSLRDIEHLYRVHAHDLHVQCSVSRDAADRIVKGLADRSLLEQELELIEQYAVQWTTIYDEDYPHNLAAIHLPPSVVYWQGRPPAFYTHAIAFVGSRKATQYSYSVLKYLIPELVNQGYGTVSGGALGADSMAHTVTLEARGSSLAVIGSGLLRPYPASNKPLFQALREHNGTVMSCFPLSMGALPGNFPARNRIIAGLSSACIVTQAALESGALITAYYALEQGREVGAVPGSIHDELSGGCHKLISQGALIVTHANDILAALGKSLDVLSKSSKKPVRLGEHISEQISDPVIEACRMPKAFDELLEATGLPVDQLHERLFALHCDGYIEQNFMGLWCVRLPLSS